MKSSASATSLKEILVSNASLSSIIDNPSTIQDLDEVWLSSEPYAFNESSLDSFSSRFNAQARLVDGEAFSWYGSRLLKSADYFKTINRLVP